MVMLKSRFPLSTSLTRLAVPSDGTRSARERPCWSIRYARRTGTVGAIRGHCLRIDAVIFILRSEKSDYQNAVHVPNDSKPADNRWP